MNVGKDVKDVSYLLVTQRIRDPATNKMTAGETACLRYIGDTLTAAIKKAKAALPPQDYSRTEEITWIQIKHLTRVGGRLVPPKGKKSAHLTNANDFDVCVKALQKSGAIYQGPASVRRARPAPAPLRIPAAATLRKPKEEKDG